MLRTVQSVEEEISQLQNLFFKHIEIALIILKKNYNLIFKQHLF